MIRNSKAFSMVEVLMAIGILGVVALTTSSMITMIMKTSTTAARSQGEMSLYYELYGILGNPALCSDSLRGSVSASGTPLVVAYGNLAAVPKGAGTTAVVLKAGVAYNFHSINTINLVDVVQVGTNYRAVVEVRGTKNSQVYNNQEFLVRVPVYYSTDLDTPPRIKDCLGNSNDNSAVCAAIGGTWSIKYPLPLPPGGVDKNGKPLPPPPPEMFCDQCTNLGGYRMTDGTCLINAGLNTGYMWQIGSWDRCSNDLQARAIECMSTSSGEIVAPTLCPIPKPLEWRPCIEADWQVGTWGSCYNSEQTRIVRCIALRTLALTPEVNCKDSKPPVKQTCWGKWVQGSGALLGYNYDPKECKYPTCALKKSVPTYKDSTTNEIKPCLIPDTACNFNSKCKVGDTQIDSIKMNCVVDDTNVTADFLCTCQP